MFSATSVCTRHDRRHAAAGGKGSHGGHLTHSKDPGVFVLIFAYRGARVLDLLPDQDLHWRALHTTVITLSTWGHGLHHAVNSAKVSGCFIC
jgi:hypothetical protein